MVKDFKPANMAWFVRSGTTTEAKKVLMYREGVPWFIQWLLMWPAIQKWEKTITAPLEEVIAGEKKK